MNLIKWVVTHITSLINTFSPNRHKIKCNLGSSSILSYSPHHRASVVWSSHYVGSNYLITYNMSALYFAVVYVQYVLCIVLYTHTLNCTCTCAVLYCTVLYCTVLYCTVLYCTVLHFTILIEKIKWNMITWWYNTIWYKIIWYRTL